MVAISNVIKQPMVRSDHTSELFADMGFVMMIGNELMTLHINNMESRCKQIVTDFDSSILKEHRQDWQSLLDKLAEDKLKKQQ